jgi:hypothetical protein
LLATLSAQEPPREGIFGEVRTVDGKPWVGAAITLLHVAHPALIDERFVDRVTTTTDERGRFRAQLLTGMTYVVWAHGPVVDGMWRSSALVRDVAAGVPVLLQEADPQQPRRVRLQLDPGWRGTAAVVALPHFGPFTLREELRLEQGEAVLPLSPESSVTVQVELDGVPVYRSFVSTRFAAFVTRRKRVASENGQPEPDETELRREFERPQVLAVAAPVEHRIRLVDSKQRPLPGARVVEDGREPRRLLGIADQDGVVRWVHAPEARLPNRALAFAVDCAETEIGNSDWVEATLGEPKDKAMAVGTAVRGRLLVGDGVPAAAQPLLLEGSIALASGGTFFGVDARLFTTSADGTFEVPGRIASHSYYLTTVLTPPQRALLAGPSKAPVAAVALLVPPSGEAPADLGELRLDRLRPLDLQVVGVDGGISGPVAIVVIPHPRAGLGDAPHEPLAARTDRHGRLRLLATAGAECAVWAMGQNGAAWAIVKPGDKERRLQLDAAHALALQVVDPDGKPLTGITVHVVTPAGSPVGDEGKALLPRVRDAFMVHGFPGKQVVTDAQGLGQLVMPFAGVGIDVVFYRGRESMRITLSGAAFTPGQPTRVEFVPNGG